MKTFISPKIIFGRGTILELSSILPESNLQSYNVYFIDGFFLSGNIENLKSIKSQDLTFYVDTVDEPKTSQVDNYVKEILERKACNPAAIVGIGGGTIMDIAKAVSICLTSKCNSEELQGWDLVKQPGIFKIGIPTISGTGAEVSRTTVLSSPKKKQGINSVFSMFDFIILDPDLLKTVQPLQRFYTGMDCYIHSVEAINGHYINDFSRAYAEKALELCENIFLENGTDDELMVASMFGGYSIVYSEVGVCHALSYGLSHAFGIHHGEANCIVMDHLSEYYPDHVNKFKKMTTKFGIELRKNLTRGINDKLLDEMINVTLLMEKPLNNALGENWRSIFTRERIRDLFLKM